MLIIDNKSDLELALASALPAGVRQLLVLRGELIDLATFVIVEAADTKAAVAAAVTFPIEEDAPPWEWVLHHDGMYEAPIILSDDGAGYVLLVPDDDGIDSNLLALLRDHAVEAQPS